jgi:hypothetical protein
MTALRNLLTFLGIVAIIAIGVFIYRPEIFNSVLSKQQGAQQIPPMGKMYAILSGKRGTLIEDTTLTTVESQNALKFSLPELTEGDAHGIPSPSSSYLLVINKAKNEMRYWKLTKNVRKVSLRSQGFDVKLETQSTPQNPQFQAILWIPRDSDNDLKLEFELGPVPSKS